MEYLLAALVLVGLVLSIKLYTRLAGTLRSGSGHSADARSDDGTDA